VPARASEIFDWLRGLPGVHPLSALCDVYTYTTIIAQVKLGFRADGLSLQQGAPRDASAGACTRLPASHAAERRHLSSGTLSPAAALQCGTGQGLGTALALAAEMRGRGIALNCHAFSALMNGVLPRCSGLGSLGFRLLYVRILSGDASLALVPAAAALNALRAKLVRAPRSARPDSSLRLASACRRLSLDAAGLEAT
jgi:hypothetical protein